MNLALLASVAPLAVWGFCAFGAAWVADTKGYSYTGWLLLGVLFGPFAVLVVGLAASKPDNVADRREAEARAEYVRKRDAAEAKGTKPSQGPA